jgi:scyllo-inosamine-4-phosphate amidinotransferase 1
MRINSSNEWSKLKSVVVGSATDANWPSTDPVFAEEAKKTTWTETPVPSGPVPKWIIDEANEDLEILADTLIKLRVSVYRPKDMDFPRLGGMYNYCPRDRFIIAGKIVIDPAMMYPCREIESVALSAILDATEHYIKMPRNQGMVLDAANVCRMGDRWLFLESPSGNRKAYEWLCQQLPDIQIDLVNFYSGVHIDSTITPLREGLVALNASRVNQVNCPKAFDGWEKIWVQDVVAQDFYQYPYASKWVGMNMLSIDENTVVIDAAQTQLIKDLERCGITSIPLTLRHSRTLGGSFHCVTLDLIRE